MIALLKSAQADIDNRAGSGRTTAGIATRPTKETQQETHKERLMIATAERWMLRGLEAILVILLAVMIAMVFGNVVLRYGFNSGITCPRRCRAISSSG
jgi:hypothetical protein